MDCHPRQLETLEKVEIDDRLIVVDQPEGFAATIVPELQRVFFVKIRSTSLDVE